MTYRASTIITLLGVLISLSTGVLGVVFLGGPVSWFTLGFVLPVNFSTICSMARVMRT